MTSQSCRDQHLKCELRNCSASWPLARLPMSEHDDACTGVGTWNPGPGFHHIRCHLRTLAPPLRTRCRPTPRGPRKPSQDRAFADNRCFLPDQVTESLLFAGAVRPTTKNAPEGTSSVSKMVRSPFVPGPVVVRLSQALRTTTTFADTASKDLFQRSRDGSGHPRDVSGREPWRIAPLLTRSLQ